MKNGKITLALAAGVSIILTTSATNVFSVDLFNKQKPWYSTLSDSISMMNRMTYFSNLETQAILKKIEKNTFGSTWLLFKNALPLDLNSASNLSAIFPLPSIDTVQNSGATNGTTPPGPTSWIQQFYPDSNPSNTGFTPADFLRWSNNYSKAMINEKVKDQNILLKQPAMFSYQYGNVAILQTLYCQIHNTSTTDNSISERGSSEASPATSLCKKFFYPSSSAPTKNGFMNFFFPGKFYIIPWRQDSNNDDSKIESITNPTLYAKKELPNIFDGPTAVSANKFMRNMLDPGNFFLNWFYYTTVSSTQSDGNGKSATKTSQQSIFDPLKDPEITASKIANTLKRSTGLKNYRQVIYPYLAKLNSAMAMRKLATSAMQQVIAKQAASPSTTTNGATSPADEKAKIDALNQQKNLLTTKLSTKQIQQQQLIALLNIEILLIENHQAISQNKKASSTNTALLSGMLIQLTRLQAGNIATEKKDVAKAIEALAKAAKKSKS